MGPGPVMTTTYYYAAGALSQASRAFDMGTALGTILIFWFVVCTLVGTSIAIASALHVATLILWRALRYGPHTARLNCRAFVCNHYARHIVPLLAGADSWGKIQILDTVVWYSRYRGHTHIPPVRLYAPGAGFGVIGDTCIYCHDDTARVYPFFCCDTTKLGPRGHAIMCEVCIRKHNVCGRLLKPGFMESCPVCRSQTRLCRVTRDTPAHADEGM